MGGAGVQRSAKFVKYLSQFGYSSAVVFEADVKKTSLTLSKDDSLSEEVSQASLYPIQMIVPERKIAKLSHSSLLRKIPGMRYRGLTRAATRLCKRVVERENPDVLCVTVSPFEMTRVAVKIAQKYRLPWVLDLRDPWALDPIMYYPSKWHYHLDMKTMSRMCRAASAVIMNTPRSLAALKDRFPDLPEEKLFCITNGWDSEDFKKSGTIEAMKDNPRQMVLVHTGTFHTFLASQVDETSREILGINHKPFMAKWRYSPGDAHLLARTPYYLLAAVRHLRDQGKVRPDNLKLVFVGGASDSDTGLVDRFGMEDMVRFTGYVDHMQSIQYLKSADLLFLPLHVPKGDGFPLIVPGKTYEYLAARKPLLAALPEGDARDFVCQSGLGHVCNPTDVQDIAGQLDALLEQHKSEQGIKGRADDAFIQTFERRNLTKKFAGVLDYVTERN